MNNNLEELVGLKPMSSNLLYVLCDFELLNKKQISINDFVKLCIKKKPVLLQYRDKISSLENQKKNLLYLKKNLNIPIIINDKVELCEFCDGLHLGQEDIKNIHSNKKIAISLLRKRIGKKLLGLSTHNEIEILEANNLEIDMIGLGAYKSTTTKNVSSILGDRLPYLAKISRHPVCAIGGVKVNDKIDNVQFNVVGSSFFD